MALGSSMSFELGQRRGQLAAREVSRKLGDVVALIKRAMGGGFEL